MVYYAVETESTGCVGKEDIMYIMYDKYKRRCSLQWALYACCVFIA